MDENDPELLAAVDQAAIAMLGKEMRTDTGGDPDALEHTRKAAFEICRRAQILSLLHAVSAGGELRPPPTWPLADIVATGGSPAQGSISAWLSCDVRTYHPERGILKVPLRMTFTTKPTQDQIAAAYDRGYWQLKAWLR